MHWNSCQTYACTVRASVLWVQHTQMIGFAKEHVRWGSTHIWERCSLVFFCSGGYLSPWGQRPWEWQSEVGVWYLGDPQPRSFGAVLATRACVMGRTWHVAPAMSRVRQIVSASLALWWYFFTIILLVFGFPIFRFICFFNKFCKCRSVFVHVSQLSCSGSVHSMLYQTTLRMHAFSEKKIEVGYTIRETMKKLCSNTAFLNNAPGWSKLAIFTDALLELFKGVCLFVRWSVTTLLYPRCKYVWCEDVPSVAWVF